MIKLDITLIVWLVCMFIVGMIHLVPTVFYALVYKKKITRKADFPTVEFIIPFYNEEEVLEKKILNTATFQYPKDRLLITFLDDHSTDKSIKIINTFAKRLPFKYRIIHSKGPQGKPNAMNYLFSKLKSEISVWTDSDSFLDKKAIAYLVQDFQDQTIGGVSGEIHVLKPEGSEKTYNDENLYRSIYRIWRRGEAAVSSITVCNGPIMAFRNSLIRKIKINSNSKADDTELAFRIIKAGYRVGYNEKAIAYEYTPLSTKERMFQKMRRNKGIVTVFWQNLTLLKRPKFGTFVFPSAFLMHIISPILVAIGIVSYIAAAVKIPWLFLLLLALFIPKLGKAIMSFVETELIMLCSILVKKIGWHRSASTRKTIGT